MPQGHGRDARGWGVHAGYWRAHMRNPLLFARVAITLALAWAAAAACVALHTPLPWMIGPLLVTSLLSIGGAPTESWAPLRNAGQWSIGASLGLYFTPQVVALVADRIAWSLFWCLQAAALLRIAASVPGIAGLSLPWLLPVAAGLWAGTMGVWGLRLGRWYGCLRADGRPG